MIARRLLKQARKAVRTAVVISPMTVKKLPRQAAKVAKTATAEAALD